MNKEDQLVEAIKGGAVELVKELIAQGADVNAKHEDKEGYSNRTPLMYAAMGGHLEIVKLLLAAGADHKAKDRFIMPSEGGGETPLHHAIDGKHYEIVQVLIKAGAKVNAKSGSETILMAAVSKGDAKMVQVLLENGADPSAGKGAFTPLSRAMLDMNAAMAELLLRAGADANYQDPHFGHTYLMDAAKHGKIAIIQALLDAKATVDTRDHLGRAALMVAAEGGEMVQIKDSEYSRYADDPRLVGSSTLCTDKNAAEIAELLIRAGADVNARTPSGWSPLMFAMMAPPDRGPVIQVLKQNGASEENADWIPVLQALKADKSWKEIEPIFSRVKNPGIRIWQGDILLHWINENAEQELATRSMIERGADPNLGATDSYNGMAFLSYAVSAKNEALVRWLIRKGANPNLTNRDGRSIISGFAGTELLRPIIREEMKEKFREEPLRDEVPPDFTAAAQAPQFQASVFEMAKRLGSPAEALFKDRSGGFAFGGSAADIEAVIATEQGNLLRKNVYALTLDAEHTGLGVLPTNSWVEAVAFLQTSAPNYSLTNSAIIRRLQEIELEFPFMVTGAGGDFIEGRFTEALRNSKKVAQQFYELCPDLVDQGAGTVANAAAQLKKTRQFFLWWD